MSDTKRKTFAFHQEDLDWINPLILEWAKENQSCSVPPCGRMALEI